MGALIGSMTNAGNAMLLATGPGSNPEKRQTFEKILEMLPGHSCPKFVPILLFVGVRMQLIL